MLKAREPIKVFKNQTSKYFTRSAVVGVTYQNSELSIHVVYLMSFQVIELDLDQLPDGEEVLSILRQEAPPLNTWVTLAVCHICNSF